jgi:hypothetical protein
VDLRAPRRARSGRRSGLSISLSFANTVIMLASVNCLRDGWKARVTAARVVCKSSGTERYWADARYCDVRSRSSKVPTVQVRVGRAGWVR